MILLIDNYDSFSYNLYQLVGSVEPDIRVIRNDEATVEEIDSLKPEAILLSPGPGRTRGRRHLYSGHPSFRGQGSHLRSLPGASGHLRGLRRNGLLRKRADARQEKADP